MKYFMLVLLAIAAETILLKAQGLSSDALGVAPIQSMDVSITLAAIPGEPRGGGDDPVYKIYKKGYNLILDEQWEEARKQFAEVVKKYPKSEYVDDAEYWSAYALRHIDKKKAIKAYEKFLVNYPHSSYYDDATSDLSQIAPKPFIIGRVGGKVVGADSGYVDENGFMLSRTNGKGFSYMYGFGPNQKIIERQLKNQLRAMAHMRLPGKSPPPFPGLNGLGGDLDQETRLKMEALHALGETKEDSTAFRSFRDVAINTSNATDLRIAAMDELAQCKKYDPFPVFLEIAKNDTSEQIQTTAIDHIGMFTKDKNRSVETLIELFNAIPKNRTDQRQNIFYSIAEVGNDRAVDFLATIAKTYDNYDLRSTAVYYLGSIGTDRARAALYEILRGK
ncbi:MAG: HEAT repeat domain-containing protein [Ignavibacteria bacterium]|nr:HEAT repeat domain-containing protein [Ignavibacteria bacterium]